LIENKVRNIAQIEFDESEFKDSSQLKELYKFLGDNNISFIKNNFGIVIGKKSNLLDIGLELENNYNYEKFAKNLGSFYKCASNTFDKNNHRVVIQCSVNGFNFELFAQMCNKDVLQRNLSFTYGLVDDISNLFHKLDKDIFVNLQIYKNFNTTNEERKPDRNEKHSELCIIC